MEHDATLAGLKVHDELLVHVLAVHGCECGQKILHPAGAHRWIQKDQLVMAKENRNAEKDACQDNAHIDGFVLVLSRPPHWST